jgi:hypothetical protein
MASSRPTSSRGRTSGRESKCNKLAPGQLAICAAAPGGLPWCQAAERGLQEPAIGIGTNAIGRVGLLDIVLLVPLLFVAASAPPPVKILALMGLMGVG